MGELERVFVCLCFTNVILRSIVSKRRTRSTKYNNNNSRSNHNNGKVLGKKNKKVINSVKHNNIQILLGIYTRKIILKYSDKQFCLLPRALRNTRTFPPVLQRFLFFFPPNKPTERAQRTSTTHFITSS